MDAISPQLKKGVLDILLLRLLSEGPMYGYELLVTLEVRGGGTFGCKEGTLYPILYRLEDAGHIESRWEQDSARRGVPRKYYTITAGGRDRLRLAGRELTQWMRAIESIMGEEFIHG